MRIFSLIDAEKNSYSLERENTPPRTSHPLPMIIPIKCFTCGNVIADKYRYYLEKVRERKINNSQGDDVIYLTRQRIANHQVEQTVEGQVMDSLGLTNVCCRRHMLTHVDIE
jgi:DNA-directed RNA polymerase I, II, and III subunit RPABC5